MHSCALADSRQVSMLAQSQDRDVLLRARGAHEARRGAFGDGDGGGQGRQLVRTLCAESCLWVLVHVVTSTSKLARASSVSIWFCHKGT